MGDFMKAHPNLAKTMLPNCGQGKATAMKLWEELSRKLNAVGPPVKDAKMWRKAYADQKYQAKKKLSFNKASKSRTGGGPYEEKFITEAEENIIEASGLEVTVDGMANVQTFGRNSTPQLHPESHSPDKRESEGDVTMAEFLIDSDVENVQSSTKRKQKTNVDPKLVLLEDNLKACNESRTNMEAKLDRLLEIQERLLEIKEEKYKKYCALHELELKIKQRELEVLYD